MSMKGRKLYEHVWEAYETSCVYAEHTWRWLHKTCHQWQLTVFVISYWNPCFWLGTNRFVTDFWHLSLKKGFVKHPPEDGFYQGSMLHVMSKIMANKMTPDEITYNRNCSIQVGHRVFSLTSVTQRESLLAWSSRRSCLECDILCFPPSDVFSLDRATMPRTQNGSLRPAGRPMGRSKTNKQRDFKD